MGKALSHPGIDPRIWACEAVVTAKKVTSDGFFVDVHLMPDKIDETARVGTVYAGNGFGFYFPIEVDDTVLVIAPCGDPDMGLIAVPRFWSQADPPPAKAISDPEDVVLEVKAGRTLRIRTTGAGSIALHPVDSGQVYLGEDLAPHPTCRGDNFQATFNAFVDIFNEHKHLDSTGALTGPPISGAIPNPGFVPFPIPGTLGPPSLDTNPLMVGTATSGSASGSGDLSPNVKVK